MVGPKLAYNFVYGQEIQKPQGEFADPRKSTINSAAPVFNSVYGMGFSGVGNDQSAQFPMGFSGDIGGSDALDPDKVTFVAVTATTSSAGDTIAWWGGTGDEVRIFWNGSGGISLTVLPGVGGGTSASSGVFNDGKPHVVIYTETDPRNRQLWVDGNLEAVVSWTGGSSGVESTNHRIGSGAGTAAGTDKIDGEIYLWALFDIQDINPALLTKSLQDYIKPANDTPYPIGAPEAAAANQYFLPGNHPLTKALRGWPSSPLVMPQSSLIEVHNRPAGFTAVHVPGSDAYNPNNIKTVATVRGVAWTNESTGNRNLKAARVPFRLFQSCTIFAYVIPASLGTTNNVHFLVGGIAANTAGGWRMMTDRVVYRTAIGAQNTDLTGFTEVGKPSVIVLKSRQGDGHWVYVDGTLLDYNTNNPQYNAVSGGDANIIGDNTTTYRGVNHQIIGVAYANRAMSDAEIVYYSKNPREIGLASNQTPFLLGAAAAPSPAPVLSNIAATLITTNSVTPQVDVDFP